MFELKLFNLSQWIGRFCSLSAFWFVRLDCENCQKRQRWQLFYFFIFN